MSADEEKNLRSYMRNARLNVLVAGESKQQNFKPNPQQIFLKSLVSSAPNKCGEFGARLDRISVEYFAIASNVIRGYFIKKYPEIW